jgi:hypothetical protein
MTNPTLKFGKLPPKASPHTLDLKKYLLPKLLPLPATKRAWEYAVPPGTWKMLGNDKRGNCVIVAVLHWIMAATATLKRPVTFTEAQAFQLYSDVTGFDPTQDNQFGDNPTDQGTAWTDMLAHWQTKGVYGHFIRAWAAIDYKSLKALKQGIDLFGGILVGGQITESMEKQFSEGKPWNKPFKGSVLGLHGYPLLGYGREGEKGVTWEKLHPMDPNIISTFDEAYVVITDDTPSGLDAAALDADIEALRV